MVRSRKVGKSESGEICLSSYERCKQNLVFTRRWRGYRRAREVLSLTVRNLGLRTPDSLERSQIGRAQHLSGVSSSAQ